MICEYCESYIRTRILDRPEDTLFKVDCPTGAPGIIEVGWFCNIEGCNHHIQSMYFTVEPIPTHE